MGNRVINFNLIAQNFPALLKGTVISLEIAFLSCLIGLILGTILGVLQTRKNKIVNSIIVSYLTILRGTPMLIQIAFMYFVLPNIGIYVSAFYCAIIAIGLNSSAYICEIVRGGINSVGKGQIEAAKCLGFTPMQIVRYIILPQAFAVTMPALGNEFIILIKDSSLASTIGVMELFKEGKYVINQTYDALSVYFAIALIYLSITITLTFLIKILEKRLNKHVKN